MNSAWKGKNVVVVGASSPGLALAGYLLAQGAWVTLTDKRPLSELDSAHKRWLSLPASCFG